VARYYLIDELAVCSQAGGLKREEKLMTDKMVAALIGVALVAGGVGGVGGWLVGRGSAGPTNAVIEMLPDHSPFADLCRQKGARVEVAVTSLEFDGEAEGAQPITDATLAEIAAQHINSTEPIRKLVLRGAQITDAGLKHINESESFDFLESLNLTNCKGITDAGLEHLKQMPSLETVNVTGCDQITDEGLKSLLKTFRVYFDRKKLKVNGRGGLE
jgi:hypothetical protein